MAGRRQSSDLIWTLGCHRSCSEQVFQSLRRHDPAFGPVVYTHKVGMHYSGGIARLLRAARQSVCNVGPSFPKSPLLRIINKQGGSLYSHFTAGEIHSHNRKSCACCRKILRGGMNVIDLNSSAPASTCRTFGQSDAGERQMKRICNYFFLSVL